MLVMVIFSNNIMIWNYNNYVGIRYLISADRIKWNDREEKMWGAKLLKPYSSSCRIEMYATTNIIIIKENYFLCYIFLVKCSVPTSHRKGFPV